MPLPTPESGVVICYEFLWSHEHAQGFDEGEKKRPCVIIDASVRNGQIAVLVAPITHQTPQNHGIELPQRVRTSLGLDDQSSWVICSELNEFVWPGRDIYPVPGGRSDQYEYGYLPPRLFKQIVQAILALDAKLKRTTPRRD